MIVPGRGNPDALGWGCFLRGFLAVLQNDPASARPWLARAAATARVLGDLPLQAQAQAMGSIAAMSARDRAAAHPTYQHALTAVSAAGGPAAPTAPPHTPP